jgi:hypothetical protein
VDNLPPQMVDEFNYQMSTLGGGADEQPREESRNSEEMGQGNFEGWEEQQP